ncbi:MAG: valine--tRNA ligase [Candidatus Omnitrophica bacterium]|nr:valine--tRNA ligase [Candidatus Omnitrophota bacterium]
MNKFETKYNPSEVEEKIYKMWEEKNYFYVKTENTKKKYVIVIPPPNITGFLHMGHALNNTIQDILIRWKRMQGFNALWVPGTDHAGIATQNVVEKELLKKGLTRKQLGREKFIEEVWKWKEEYGSRIIYQLKKLGASCDWTRIRFTMDPMLSNAVKECFVRLYKKGLIYKGKRIINWCPRCETALSDDEVEYEEVNSFLYYIKYPLLKGGFIEVATTRPETMLGDTAVAVNTKDERYKNLIGEKVKLPFVERIIPIIGDEKVEIEFGTGAVKITPAHDPNDFEIGQKHNLDFVIIMNEEGIMNENAGKFKGYERFECRKLIIEELKKLGLLSKIEDYTTRIGHCYRCYTIIEPYLSNQWFVKMAPLAEPAIRVAEEGRLKFYPERWKKVYLHWLYNVKDWCISRQIWWGHRIPVWYCENNCPPIVEKEEVKVCPYCGNKKVHQDEDVLDTWFSSWLWPFSVFGWPEKTKDLEIFYPTDTLVTAQEILFFWVARMVMAGLEFMGEIPFENVYIHGTVRDETGKKMSKSLGNVIDPVEIINKYGADSLRFGLISLTAFGQDVFLPPDFYIKGRNFTNKLWNASRYIFKKCEELNIEKVKIKFETKNLNFPENWILSKLNEIIEKTTKSLNNFYFNESLNNLYDFFWHDFCDWYLEISKVYQDIEYLKSAVIPVLCKTLITSLQLLHPFIPFITEQIWQNFKNVVELNCESIVISSWPESEKYRDEKSIKKFEKIKEIIVSIRDLKAKFEIPLSKNIDCYYEGEIDKIEENIIKKLSGVKEIKKFDETKIKEKNFFVKHLSSGRLGISFGGIINILKEKERKEKELEKLNKILKEIEKRLNNSEFLSKAPYEIIEKEKKRKEEIEEKVKNIKKDIEFIEKRRE